MKKVIIASIVAISMISVSAMAGELKLPLDSASSNVPPNNQKKVQVVERTNLSLRSSTTPTTMTVEQLVTDRPTIQYADIRGGAKLCTTDDSACVSAEKQPATIKIATFKFGVGAPMNERMISRKDFDNRKVAVPANGVEYLDCQVKNGKNTKNCRIASDV